MPVIMFERMPLPSLRTYTSISVCSFACALFYTHSILADLQLENEGQNETANSTVNATDHAKDGSLASYIDVMLSTTWCAWTLVNMAYCILILLGKLTQRAVFGELRVSEHQHFKEKFWNFIFYKFIFIFGVMNVQHMHEVVLWCAWFSLLGCLHLLSQLSKDRFEYLSFSPTTPTSTHVKVVSLLLLILTICAIMMTGCIITCYFYASLNTFAFMAAECVLLMDKTLHVLIRYGLHLWDIHHDEGVWENKAVYVYYSDLVFELVALSVDFLHHLHMLLWANIFLSMASLVICMQLRYLFHEFQRRIHRHKNYLRVVSSMEERFPLASAEELHAYNDDCAICWERLEAGRKLPCGHYYHNSCLRSWLEQDTSCPTCRTVLGDLRLDQPPPAPVPVPEIQPNPNHTVNHLFQFDGSRYVSWLPRFSVEVTHTAILGDQGDQSQLDNMIRQVREVFPSMPIDAIREDLQRTHSVQLTIENVIEGNITVRAQGANDSDGQEEHSSESSDGSSVSGEFEERYTNLEDMEYTVSQDEEEANSLEIPLVGESIDNERSQEENATSKHESSNPLPNHETVDHIMFSSGGRFSKSSTEREVMLQKRKDALLEHARKRFITSQEPGTSEHGSGDDGRPARCPDKAIRRELLAEAAQRRMQQN